MNFVGTGRRLAQGDVGDAARVLGIETAVLLAFLEVEAAGRGFDNQNRPKMLRETHIFYRELGAGAQRDRAVQQGLATPKWVRNYKPDSYPDLNRMRAINDNAALRSCSWGLGQIMGFNAQAAGHSTALAMVQTAMQGEREQLLTMVTLLKSWGLAKHLVGKDFSKPDSWRPAAKAYNGSGYETHGYHIKLAAAYVKHAKNIDAETGQPFPPKALPAPGATVLVHGMKGEAVRAVQADLQALGFVFKHGVDGRFGDETLTNVRLFQTAAGIKVDGKVGDATRKAIAASLAAKDEDLSPPTPHHPGPGASPPWRIIIPITLAAALAAFLLLAPIWG